MRSFRRIGTTFYGIGTKRILKFFLEHYDVVFSNPEFYLSPEEISELIPKAIETLYGTKEEFMSHHFEKDTDNDPETVKIIEDSYPKKEDFFMFTVDAKHMVVDKFDINHFIIPGGTVHIATIN